MYGYKRKISSEEAAKIMHLRLVEKLKLAELSKRFGLSPERLRKVIRQNSTAKAVQ